MELEPTRHLGKAVDEMRARGEYTERARRLEEVRERNAQRIEQKPEIVFDNLTRRQSTFTRRDIAREVFRYIDDGERFRNLMARLEGSAELVRLAAAVKDERGNVVEPERYTTREMLAVESRMAERAQEMADTRTHGVGEGNRDAALARHGYLSAEQREAVSFITGERQIEALTGFAGAGKSAAIAAARDAWQAEGYRVLGGALSGIAAENLQRESGVESRTLASWEKAWREGHERLQSRDVLVIDEAGMVGSRQLERIVSAAAEHGAKVVLVGDAEQLQPIEAGAAFRAIAERVGYQELSGIRRQREAWQREASSDFARGRAGPGVRPLPGTRRDSLRREPEPGQGGADRKLGRVPRRPGGGKSFAHSGPHPGRRARVESAGAVDTQGARRAGAGGQGRGRARAGGG